MKTRVFLNRNSYESAKIAVKRGSLYGNVVLSSLIQKSFDEILKFMEENGFRDSIDSSYLQFEGFYLIERILNLHLAKVYGDVFFSVSKKNKVLLETYYLKYQVHNLMVLVRCYLSEEKEIEPFLIGDERRREKYLKAFGMPNLEDAIVYISKKLKINSQEALEAYKGGVYDLENYLYKVYYERLGNFKFKFNGVDEVKFLKFVRKYVDLINSRTFMKLKVEESAAKIDFSELFIEGGTLNLDFYNLLLNLNLKDSLKKFDEVFGHLENCDDASCVASLDKRINEHKELAGEVFKVARFGSPFYTLKYLFELEREIGKLRILLKAKYMKLSDDEVKNLVGV